MSQKVSILCIEGLRRPEAESARCNEGGFCNRCDARSEGRDLHTGTHRRNARTERRQRARELIVRTNSTASATSPGPPFVIHIQPTNPQWSRNPLTVFLARKRRLGAFAKPFKPQGAAILAGRGRPRAQGMMLSLGPAVHPSYLLVM